MFRAIGELLFGKIRTNMKGDRNMLFKCEPNAINTGRSCEESDCLMELQPSTGCPTCPGL
jgi:hypothetical protein